MELAEKVVTSVEHEVESHYGRGGILDAIFHALQEAGVDTQHLKPDDLAPIDELHVRGREGTAELAHRIPWKHGMRVLDVGCGIGGSSRFLATSCGCDVTGIDLTREFVDIATRLSRLVGLDNATRFHQGNALDLPFQDNSFDVVWTQHAQMNIENKRQFYSEMARVLKPGGRMVFHDVFRNGNRLPLFPVPWANGPSTSFLTTPSNARSLIESLGLEILDWEDTTRKSLDWMIRMGEQRRQSGGPALSPLVVIGESGRVKMENAARSLSEDRLRVVQAVAEKRTR
jgi:SAM-dependent methyltransferase